MRLTHISIENFKGIRDRVEIPLRPITLRGRRSSPAILRPTLHNT